MLALSYQEILNIHQALAPGHNLKTQAGHGIDGAARLRRAIVLASQELTTSLRAARLALGIQSEQPFNDGNTRIATAIVYAIPILERSQWVRAKAYQTYGQVGHWGPRYADDANLAVTSLATWITNHMVGVPDATGRWQQIVQDIANVQGRVAWMQAELQRTDKTSRELRSWWNNRGY